MSVVSRLPFLPNPTRKGSLGALSCVFITWESWRSNTMIPTNHSPVFHWTPTKERSPLCLRGWELEASVTEHGPVYDVRQSGTEGTEASISYHGVPSSDKLCSGNGRADVLLWVWSILLPGPSSDHVLFNWSNWSSRPSWHMHRIHSCHDDPGPQHHLD